jgi:hypothetical protein
MTSTPAARFDRPVWHFQVKIVAVMGRLSTMLETSAAVLARGGEFALIATQ